MQYLIKRINELAQKAKAEGLTESELIEREQLRREYIDSVKRNLVQTLENTSFIDKDGNEIDVSPKKPVH